MEDDGWKENKVLLVVILFIKFFLFFELVFDLLVLGNLVFKVMILEFEMVDLEGRLFLYFGLLFIVLFMFL